MALEQRRAQLLQTLPDPVDHRQFTPVQLHLGEGVGPDAVMMQAADAHSPAGLPALTWLSTCKVEPHVGQGDAILYN